MIVRFAQRFASLFGFMVALIATKLIFPDETHWWLKAAVGVPIAVAVYLLLYKDGVTANRPRRR